MLHREVPPGTELNMDALLFRKARLTIRAINHKLRQQMLHLIHENGSMTVTAIYKSMNLEQSVASQQLAILRKAGIVLYTRKGKQIFYSIHYDRIQEVQRHAEKLIQVQ